MEYGKNDSLVEDRGIPEKDKQQSCSTFASLVVSRSDQDYSCNNWIYPLLYNVH